MRRPCRDYANAAAAAESNDAMRAAAVSSRRTRLSRTRPNTLAMRQIVASCARCCDVVRRIWTETPLLSRLLEIVNDRSARDAGPPRASQIPASGASAPWRSASSGNGEPFSGGDSDAEVIWTDRTERE